MRDRSPRSRAPWTVIAMVLLAAAPVAPCAAQAACSGSCPAMAAAPPEAPCSGALLDAGPMDCCDIGSLPATDSTVREAAPGAMPPVAAEALEASDLCSGGSWARHTLIRSPAPPPADGLYTLHASLLI